MIRDFNKGVCMYRIVWCFCAACILAFVIGLFCGGCSPTSPESPKVKIGVYNCDLYYVTEQGGTIHMLFQQRLGNSKYRQVNCATLFNHDTTWMIQARSDWAQTNDTTLLFTHTESRLYDPLTGEWTSYVNDPKLDGMSYIHDITDNGFTEANDTYGTMIWIRESILNN